MIKAAELVAAISALDLRMRAVTAPELSTPEEAAAYAREQGVETTPYEILEEVKIQRTRRRRSNATIARVQKREPNGMTTKILLIAVVFGLVLAILAIKDHEGRHDTRSMHSAQAQQ